jgi:DNA-binding protein YbaB
MTRETPDVEAMFGIDMAAAVDGARRMAERAATVQSRIAEPVGRAETTDGRIRLTFSPERGLPELHIGPEAMRMDARELAETIQRLVSEALKDLADRSDNRP